VYGHLSSLISGGILSYSKAFGWTANSTSLPRRLQASFHHFEIHIVWTNRKKCGKEAEECQCSKENEVGLCASWTPIQHISQHTYNADWATCFSCEMYVHLLNNLVWDIWVWRLYWLSEGSNMCQMATLLPHILAGLTAK